MSSLLKVSQANYGTTAPKKGAVGYLDFKPSEETAPYLVSSSKACVWVEKTSSEGLIKAAFREGPLSHFFLEIVESIYIASLAFKWENVFPMTVEGIYTAHSHLSSYAYANVELIIPTDEEEIKDLVIESQLPFSTESWVPKDLVIFVPKNRNYLGEVFRVTNNTFVGIVHNAARGIAFATLRVEDQFNANTG